MNNLDKYYIQHYFNWKNAGQFLLVAFVGLAAVLAIIVSIAKAERSRAIQNLDLENREDRRAYKHIRKRPYMIIESFYEMVFSSTSILTFLALYYIIDEKMPEVATIWHKYQDVFLLLFICLSVFMTAWLDMILVKLTHLTPEQKGGVRLVSTIYVVVILLYIRFIYEDTNYNELIMYFITLAVGRFIFFDFTVKDFQNLCHQVAQNLPLLVLMLVYSGLVCWYGFHVQFLLKSNGVIISVLIAHIFMDLSIFVVDKTRIMKAVV
ncbi:MAG: hypothetical protein VZR02_05750 [Lachnospiraceae bacterium]|nr:hypothetical protein [Lachnospiraceae bacterium]